MRLRIPSLLLAGIIGAASIYLGLSGRFEAATYFNLGVLPVWAVLLGAWFYRSRVTFRAEAVMALSAILAFSLGAAMTLIYWLVPGSAWLVLYLAIVTFLAIQMSVICALRVARNRRRHLSG